MLDVKTTTGSSLTCVIRDDGRVVSMTSTDPWYRLIRAFADLFLAGAITGEELQIQEIAWAQDRHDGRITDPAALDVLGALGLTWMEPCCPHDPYVGCACPPLTDDDRRARLREMIGA
jgi:hypothetical protein